MLFPRSDTTAHSRSSIDNILLIWRRHHCQWRDANFNLCSALIEIEHLGLFSVPYLPGHSASVYYHHLWVPVAFTVVAKRISVELSTCFHHVGLTRLRFEHPSSLSSKWLRHHSGLVHGLPRLYRIVNCVLMTALKSFRFCIAYTTCTH